MNSMTTDEAAFVAAIIAAPHDDTVRGAFADWLDEHDGDAECPACQGKKWRTSRWRIAEMDADEYGESSGPCSDCRATGRVPNGFAARAEFIRVQIAVEEQRGPNRPKASEANDRLQDALERRERELWKPPLNRGMIKACQPLGLATLVTQGMEYPAAGTYKAWGVVRRGFVDEVRAELAALLGGTCERCGGDGTEGDPYDRGVRSDCPECKGSGTLPGLIVAIFAAHPVMKVVVSDAVTNPVRFSGSHDGHIRCREQDAEGWIIQFHASAYQAAGIGGLVREQAIGTIHRTPAAATDALSAVVVAHLRSRAGLPPLPAAASATAPV